MHIYLRKLDYTHHEGIDKILRKKIWNSELKILKRENVEKTQSPI